MDKEYNFMCNYIICWVYIKVVNIVSVPAGMYYLDMYTDIETSTFHTSLNTGHTGQFRAILACTRRYRKKLFIYLFIFLSFVIFEFLLGQNDNLFVLTY